MGFCSTDNLGVIDCIRKMINVLPAFEDRYRSTYTQAHVLPSWNHPDQSGEENYTQTHQSS